MKPGNQVGKLGGLMIVILLMLFLAGCTETTDTCLPLPPTNWSGALAYAKNDQLDFRFPLDELDNDVSPHPAIFCSSGGIESARKYHAAEDYFLPAGTPVYAMADGIISFSGPMGGYGWLIIIDHPQANIYSLYGHLSPSRWLLESGPVGKGDLIAYLGDPDENGGSPENPLRSHLHFAIRAGQRNDYPGMGEWRWQAGWIKPCPQDLGWLQPSGVITSQEIPPGGFSAPRAGLLDKWRVEMAFVSMYLLAGVGVLVISIRKKNLIVLLIYGSLLIVAGLVLSSKGTRVSYALISLAVLLLLFTIFHKIYHSRKL